MSTCASSGSTCPTRIRSTTPSRGPAFRSSGRTRPGTSAARSVASASRSRAHAPRARRRLRRARAAHADRLHEAQPRPVPHRPVALRRARTRTPCAADHRHQRGGAPVLRRRRRAACGQGRGRPLRARRVTRAVDARTRRSQSRTARRYSSAWRGSRRRRASTTAVRALPQVPDATLSCSARGQTALRSRRSRASSASPTVCSCPGVWATWRRYTSGATSSSTPRAGRASGSRCSRRCWREGPSSRSMQAPRPSSSLNGITGLLSPPDDAAKLAENVEDPPRRGGPGRALRRARARPRREGVQCRADDDRTLAVYERAASASR